MKRLVLAAALAATAVVGVSEAGAVPVGSQNACVAGPPTQKACNFLGASDNLGVAGFSTAGYTITHQRKIVACDLETGKVAGFAMATVTDDSQTGQNPFNSQKAWATGIVFTLTIKGQGFGIVGGPGTPGDNPTDDPATPTVAAPAGSEDGTGGRGIGDDCQG